MVLRLIKIELSAPFVTMDLILIFIDYLLILLSIFLFYDLPMACCVVGVFGVLRTDPPWREK
jgi:hypothetical protein